MIVCLSSLFPLHHPAGLPCFSADQIRRVFSPFPSLPAQLSPINRPIAKITTKHDRDADFSQFRIARYFSGPIFTLLPYSLPSRGLETRHSHDADAATDEAAAAAAACFRSVRNVSVRRDGGAVTRPPAFPGVRQASLDGKGVRPGVAR